MLFYFKSNFYLVQKTPPFRNKNFACLRIYGSHKHMLEWVCILVFKREHLFNLLRKLFLLKRTASLAISWKNRGRAIWEIGGRGFFIFLFLFSIKIGILKTFSLVSIHDRSLRFSYPWGPQGQYWWGFYEKVGAEHYMKFFIVLNLVCLDKGLWTKYMTIRSSNYWRLHVSFTLIILAFHEGQGLY